MSTTRLTVQLAAPPADVYRALTTATDVQQWQVPDSMDSEVHAFDVREGGAFRISLTYRGDEAGKSRGHTDTYHGEFATLKPGLLVVESMEFETTDPEMTGEMRVTFELSANADGTELIATHDHVPPGVSPVDNELGWTMALAKLARLLEARASAAPPPHVRT